MSYHCWTEYGYGFELWNGKNLQDVKNFILKHDDVMDEETRTEFMGLPEEYDVEEFIGNPVSYTIASIINKLERVSFFSGYCACGDTDQNEMLGICPAYPCDLSPAELITWSDAHKLLKKYGKELGITEAPDFFEAEYGG